MFTFQLSAREPLGKLKIPTSVILHVRFQHALDHPKAAEASEVVQERHEDGGVLEVTEWRQ